MAVGTYTETLDSMYAMTFALRREDVVDQFFLATPFWYLMQKNGRKSTKSGGRYIEEILAYGKNETVRSITKGQNVTLAHTDVHTTSHWNWRYIAGHMIRYFVDEQQNRGKAKVKDMVNANIDVLKQSFIDYMEENMFGDGTDAFGDTTIDGLDSMVVEDPTTGTSGGFNRATTGDDWWRNVATDMSAENVSLRLLDRMRTTFNTCGKYGMGTSRFPDIIVTDQTTYEYYEMEVAEKVQVPMPDNKMADLGFGNLSFKGQPMTWSPSCKAASMYLLNTKHMKWVNDPIENMTLGEWIPIADQPRDRVAHAILVGNLVCSNMRKQGVIFDIGEAA